jgi:hypothetical protein
VTDRYQQETFTPWTLDTSPTVMALPVWNLDGVSWCDAPPPRRWHRHWAQTQALIDGVFVRRCPCGALSMRPGMWTQLGERRVRPWFRAG